MDADREEDEKQSGPNTSDVRQALRREADAWAANHGRTVQWLWTVGFQPLTVMPHFPRPIDVSVQMANTPLYLCENRLRQWEDHCYFCLTLSGVGGFADAHGIHRLPPGRAFLTPINDPATRYFYPPEATGPWRFLAFTFTGRCADDMVRDLRERYGSIYSLDLNAQIVMRLLSLEHPTYRTLHPDAIDAAELVLDLLFALAASARSREAPDAARDLVARAMQYIGEGLEFDLTVEELAERMGISRERLARAFRDRLEQSPRDILQQRRIRQACVLLKDTQLPVKEIAARMGYSDHTSFIRGFRNVTGMTPQRFRKEGDLRVHAGSRGARSR